MPFASLAHYVFLSLAAAVRMEMASGGGGAVTVRCEMMSGSMTNARMPAVTFCRAA